MYKAKYFVVFLMYILLFSCTNEEVKKETLFELVSANESGISFTNQLSFSQDFNVYKYRNFYNGGGVAIGDINNDGLVDIYLTANQATNKLFLNKGNFKFEDITDKAKVGGTKAWSTGVTMVDINGDGFLDIYVCNSGDVVGDNKQNELFINNGDSTFTDQAEVYGLDDKGFSTHASFFDFDKDGDLDVYLLNNSYQAIGSFNLQRNERPKRDILGGDKLLENVDGKFVDISEKAGIYGSVIGFGLGVTIGDTNNDGWEDIFVSNDFFERDYLYINQKNGTFKEALTNQMKSISGASMGADMADINNDGFNDIFVTEMLPSEYKRLKTVTTFEDWNKYQYNVKNGYYHQFTRNTLQLNNGNETFSEIGRLGGVQASDWSWGALLFDMDNDGLKDLFIANGIYKDLTNQDYLQYISNEEVIKGIVKNQEIDFNKLIEIIPSNEIENQSYKNLGKLEFKLFEDSGLQQKSFSNGSAYGDFDNDGDLDLVVNNVNMPFFLYRNTSDTKKNNNYLKLILKGEGKNTNAIGAQIRIETATDSFYMEQQPIRGFQSSMDLRPNVGIGKAVKATVKITWPNGKVSILKDQDANQSIILYQKDALNPVPVDPSDASSLFAKSDTPLNYLHIESRFIDFNRDRLLNHMLSTEGPKLALGDVNNDGITDVFIGGAKGQASSLYLGTKTGFTLSKNLDFDKNAISEDTASVFFDADNDGDLDLYVCSGGVEFSPFSPNYYDHLYLNNGTGKFIDSNQKLPLIDVYKSTSTVQPIDFDADGDLDLFVGERSVPGRYGVKGSGFLLENDGKGNFKDVTSRVAPQLLNIGMITDALVADLNNDKLPDLVVIGEFMDIQIFASKNGTLEKSTANNAEVISGWWNTVKAADLDNDGDLDLIIGNHGLNSQFKASKEHPIRLYAKDFDKNGYIDPILTFNAPNGKDYPYALRHDLIDQIKSLKKKFPNYASFEDATIQDMFDAEDLKDVIPLEANTMETILLINEGNFKFKKQKLPVAAQLAPIYAIETYDFDGDNDIDILMGGNLFNVKPQVGRYDASYGVYLENKGNLNFETSNKNNGFTLFGEIRDIKIDAKKEQFYVTRNNDSIATFTFKNNDK
ncbi:FG-GAP-like repeat-containing protein [Cellulophaga sp. Hel_I_12]|uniref:FG-GAP-like repeat-containing protein n=1 Tax=Cellulophaga sp. Hel_I_12 TaxID=1249972 RepID=UPI0006461AB2|nr:FG-GAP-like repeat-containing protein [Cellulophaga sp. Hel_I_12]